MRLLRLLLFPLTPIYALAVILRNRAFDLGILKSRKFKIPVISVGNLTVGGSGKSPMTEYLVRLLKNDYKIAVLSRGYGRRSSGFITVKFNSLASDVGDEPLQIKQKFPEVTVAVCENRVEGIKELKQQHQLILLDDAYQHRAVRPGFSILLYDFNSLHKFQWMLPSGDLREPLNSRKRADVIVVTKTPTALTDDEKIRIRKRVKPFPNQQIFFSYLLYGELTNVFHSEQKRKLQTLRTSTQVLLLTGIANPGPLLAELKKYTPLVTHHQFPDHHQFSKKNISKLAGEFAGFDGPDKLIITTGKDAQRLKDPANQAALKRLPVYYLPVQTAFHAADREAFRLLINDYVRKHSVNHRIYKA